MCELIQTSLLFFFNAQAGNKLPSLKILASEEKTIIIITSVLVLKKLKKVSLSSLQFVSLVATETDCIDPWDYSWEGVIL